MSKQKEKDEMFESLKKIALEIVKEGDDHVPIAFVVMPDGNIQPIMMDSSDRKESVRALRKFVGVVGSQRYYFIFSAWTLREKKGETKEQTQERLRTRPSESPDREDALVCSRFEKGKDPEICMFMKEDGEYKEQDIPKGGELFSIWNIWPKKEQEVEE